jgi:type II secretory pathway pseudopilin PulG
MGLNKGKGITMKKFKSVLGATLLEVMLVLAIAAMIVVMSIRYYQSATTTAQANAYMDQVLTISAAANNYAQSAGSYTGVTNAVMTNLLPTGGLTTPWGATITVVGSASGLTITPASGPAQVCALMVGKFAGNSKYSVTSGTSCAVAYTP